MEEQISETQIVRIQYVPVKTRRSQVCPPESVAPRSGCFLSIRLDISHLHGSFWFKEPSPIHTVGLLRDPVGQL
jgi:hypothetical protein